jgi:prevent-host-death family protein
MKQIALYEAKNTLSALIAEVERTGEEVIITRHGKPAVRIGPVGVDRSPEAMKALGERLLANLERQRAEGWPDKGPTWEQLKAEMEDDLG